MSDTSDFHHANSGTTPAAPIKMAAKAVTVGVILYGLIYAATPFHRDAGLSGPECFPTVMPTAAGRVSMVETLALVAAALTTIEAMRQQADRPARTLLIHPIWRH